MLKKLSLTVLLVVLAFVGTTLLALELGGVLLVETADAEGNTRVTHIWFVEEQGKVLLEGGNPNNPWVEDLASLESIKIEGEDLDGEYRFVVHDSQADRERIRALMRAKYGWRDWWVDLLFDTSQSTLIKLEPLAAGRV